MTAHMQNPGVPAGASRDHFGWRSHPSLTASDLRAQILASRFSLSPWMAREVSRLCFGEAGND